VGNAETGMPKEPATADLGIWSAARQPTTQSHAFDSTRRQVWAGVEPNDVATPRHGDTATAATATTATTAATDAAMG